MQEPLPPAPFRPSYVSPPAPSPQPPPQRSGCVRTVFSVLFVVAIAYAALYLIYPSIGSILSSPSVIYIDPDSEIDKNSVNTTPEFNNQTNVDPLIYTREVYFNSNSCQTFPVVKGSGNRKIKWLIDLKITKIAIRSSKIVVYFEIKRTAPTQQMWWSMDEEERQAISLKTQNNTFSLLGAGGFFTKDTVLQPGEVHAGWLAFEMPDREIFELTHPNIKPRFIIDLQQQRCQTI
jgi:hypothetical protein